MRCLNSKERPTLDEALAREVNPLTLDQVLALRESARRSSIRAMPPSSPPRICAGSLNIGLGGQYATWAGTILNREHPIVVIADPGREHESAIRLGRIGFDHIVGYLAGRACAAWRHVPDLTATTERISASAGGATAGGRAPPLAVDVRGPGERAQKVVAGSVSIPLNQSVRTRRRRAATRIVRCSCYCAGGYRSSIAASLLQQQGFTQVSEIAGGIAAWEAAKLPMEPRRDSAP